MLTAIFGVLTAAGVTGVAYMKLWAFNYWSRHGLPTLETNFPLGHAQTLLFQKCSLANAFKSLYDEIKQEKLRHGGLYLLTEPLYMPVEKSIIDLILSNENGNFKEVLLSKPTDKKNLKNLCDTSFEKALSFAQHISIEGGTNVNFSIIIKQIKKNFMLEYFFNQKSIQVESILQSVKDRFTHGRIKIIFTLYSKYILNYFETNHAHQFELSLLKKEILKVLSGRNASIIHEIAQLVDMKEENSISEITELASEYIKCLSIVFISVLPFCFYEISCNNEVQEKLRKEIELLCEANNGKMKYDLLTNMKYLDQVIKETLRKYPPCPIIIRKCVKSIVIPSSVVELQNGINAVISTLGIHHDEETYIEPERFNPGRFSEGNGVLPNCVFVPFGRNELTPAEEFAIFQAKLILYILLKDYKFSRAQSDDLSMATISPRFYLEPNGPIYLNIAKVE